MKEVITYYLEMKYPEQVSDKRRPEDFCILECEIKQFEFNRFLYQLIGGPWKWVDKLTWPDEKWIDYAENDNLRTWVAYHKGSPAGYYDLQKQAGGDVEIAYFGLVPRFIGKGFGGYLLSEAIRCAWKWPGTKRVWVHTCTLDHPGALANYKARGMKIYREEREKL
ncbi:MAG: GNAT family N-acetyltransferase [Desulforhopalus sp.]